MGAAAVEMDYEGACVEAEEPEACNDVWAPVCGSDGKTYGNMCNLKGSDARYLFDGTCEANEERLTCSEITPPVAVEDSSQPCTREYVPVCGEDGIIYSNLCMMENAGVELAAEDNCSTELAS